MGARGPKPLPKNVHQLRGNASKLPLHRMADGFEPEIDVPGCPEFLLPEARKEWRRVSKLLRPHGMIAKEDRAALSLYTQEWAWYAWSDSMFQRDVAKAAGDRAAHEAAEEARRLAAVERGEVYSAQPWTGGDGVHIPTANGSFTYNPNWVARCKHAAALDKFLASFGLSPSSRGRVSPSSRQPYLPGLEPKGGFEAL
ncbi:MAG TPA: P27 family phage terminase small subunit [Burkholderiales bacterium]